MNTSIITGIIGAGRAGCSIGKYLSEEGVPVAGFYDISQDAADSAAAFSGTKSFEQIEDLVEQSSLIFLTTPDRMIQDVWNEIKQFSLEHKIICHCSGALSSSAFTGIEDTNASACSLHPMLPFSNRFSSYQQLKHAFFTIEGQEPAVQTVSGLFTALGNTVCMIPGDCKVKYHAAASILSNQIIAVLDTGYRLLEECGFTREDAVSAAEGLIRQNIENTMQIGCINALTGPIERNDLETVQKHLACLNEEDQSMYRILGQKLVQIARQKNPMLDYSRLQKILEET